MATLPYFQDAGRQNLTPELLRLLSPIFGGRMEGTGDASGWVPDATPMQYAQKVDGSDNMLAFYDPEGNYLGDDKRSEMDRMDKLIRAIVMGGAGLVGGGALAQTGAFGGAAGGAAGGGGLAGAAEQAAIEAALTGSSTGGLVPGASQLGLGGFSPITAETLGLSTLGQGALGTAGVGSLPSAVAGSNLLNGVAGAAGGLPWQSILGAGIGALSSQDQTQSASRSPWEPAQPFLKDLLGQGQQMQQKLAAEPFTPQQKTGYNNLGGLLNSINSNAQGLLAGANANASGANRYDPKNPRRQLTGSAPMDLSQFMPGLLNFFPRSGP